MSKSAKRKPLTAEQKKMLQQKYYKEKNYFGRDKLFNLVKNSPGHPTKDQVGEWLKTQQVHQLHLKQKRSNTLKPVVLKKPDSLFEMDIVDMGEDADENRYILTMINVFNRYAYAEALPNKNEPTVLKAVKKILQKIPKISRLQSDNGGEFINASMKSFLKSKNITQVLTVPGKPQSNGIIERFNGTLKSMIQKDITTTFNKNWSSNLQTYINNYNASIHDTLKMSPIEASVNTQQAFKNVEKKASRYTGRKHEDIKVGDKVRIKKFKGKLEKHSKINWTQELYEVEKVIQPTKPYNSTKYKLKNDSHSYVRNDLQLITEIEKPPQEVRELVDGEYEIEEILKKELDEPSKKMMYLIKWRGYDDQTWEYYDKVKGTVAYGIFLKKSKNK